MEKLTTVATVSYVLRDRNGAELIGRSWTTWEAAERFAARLTADMGWWPVAVEGWAIVEHADYPDGAPSAPEDACEGCS